MIKKYLTLLALVILGPFSWAQTTQEAFQKFTEAVCGHLDSSYANKAKHEIRDHLSGAIGKAVADEALFKAVREAFETENPDLSEMMAQSKFESDVMGHIYAHCELYGQLDNAQNKLAYKSVKSIIGEVCPKLSELDELPQSEWLDYVNIVQNEAIERHMDVVQEEFGTVGNDPFFVALYEEKVANCPKYIEVVELMDKLQAQESDRIKSKRMAPFVTSYCEYLGSGWEGKSKTELEAIKKQAMEKAMDEHGELMQDIISAFRETFPEDGDERFSDTFESYTKSQCDRYAKMQEEVLADNGSVLTQVQNDLCQQMQAEEDPTKISEARFLELAQKSLNKYNEALIAEYGAIDDSTFIQTLFLKLAIYCDAYEKYIESQTD
ncbi:hypothetical protein [Sediminicola luteus]|uniref:DUF3829 domain-containing protein n=1 Tax=Sediminicola luteus TaxID=319238 RepID=A0A2A4GCG0_9FLAO|nr:hypothetical protein [Sediminicola luteus]PCE66101.1 hypothetical protein B7P33_02030 [Sediminicola luteus]